MAFGVFSGRDWLRGWVVVRAHLEKLTILMAGCWVDLLAIDRTVESPVYSCPYGRFAHMNAAEASECHLYFASVIGFGGQLPISGQSV